MTPLSEIESKRAGEQLLLDGAKSHAERNRLGQFATPFPLALDIAQAARALWHRQSELPRFLEPALGTGAFYSAALQTFAAPLASATGIEIDPIPAEAAARMWQPSGLSVISADFTRLLPPPQGQRATLVLTNPPYSRHHHLGPDKARLQALAHARTGIAVSGLSGLYVHFMLLAHEWMDEEALAAWLIPSEFMDVNYGRALRDYLTNRVTLRQIHLFDPADTQFADALVSSAVVIFEKRFPPSNARAAFTHGGTVSAPRSTVMRSTDSLRTATKWTALFPNAAGVIPSNVAARGSFFDEPIQTATGRQHTTLGSLFEIKRGLVTGDNRFFLIHRARAVELGLPDFALTPMLPSPRHLPLHVIDADADGWPLIDPQLVLVGTSKPLAQLKTSAPALATYFEQGVQAGVNQGYITSRREPWYMPERRTPAPFLCTYMGRDRAGGTAPFRVVWNRSQAVVSNVWLMLYPKPELALLLAESPALYPVVHAELNAAIHAAGRGGRVYGGGLHKFEPRELAALSLTNDFAWSGS